MPVKNRLLAGVLLVAPLVVGHGTSSPERQGVCPAICGTVTDTHRAAIAGVRVSAWLYDPEQAGPDPEDDGWIYMAEDYTDGNGTYALGGLAAGSYRVQYYDFDQLYLTEFWDDEESLEASDDVVVSEGGPASGIDAVLDKGASVAGTVSTDDFTDTQWFNVQLYRKLPSGAFELDDHYTLTYDDVSTVPYDGAYEIIDVRPGTYRLRVLGDEYVQGEYWNDRTTLESAHDLVVGAGQTVTGIDVVLTADGPQPPPPPPVGPPADPPAPVGPPADPPAPAFHNVRRPKVVGARVVGSVLVARGDRWDPAPERRRYRWRTPDGYIKGANARTFKVTRGLVGTFVAVTVVASVPNEQSLSSRSTWFGRIKPAPRPRMGTAL